MSLNFDVFNFCGLAHPQKYFNSEHFLNYGTLSFCYVACFKSLKANGLDERFNQKIQNMLVKFVSSKKSKWSRYIDICIFAYNTSRHESTKFTPFEVMFNRTATLPIDIAVRKESPEKILELALNHSGEGEGSKELLEK